MNPIRTIILLILLASVIGCAETAAQPQVPLQPIPASTPTKPVSEQPVPNAQIMPIAPEPAIPAIEAITVTRPNQEYKPKLLFV